MDHRTPNNAADTVCGGEIHKEKRLACVNNVLELNLVFTSVWEPRLGLVG
jgi:hypothetical protein